MLEYFLWTAELWYCCCTNFGGYTPRKLTCPLKIVVGRQSFPLDMAPFVGHACFWRCSSFWKKIAPIGIFKLEPRNRSLIKSSAQIDGRKKVGFEDLRRISKKYYSKNNWSIRAFWGRDSLTIHHHHHVRVDQLAGCSPWTLPSWTCNT